MYIYIDKKYFIIKLFRTWARNVLLHGRNKSRKCFRVCNRRSSLVIVNASNWRNAIAASRNGERQKWMINTFLCAYGAACMCKLISLSSSRARVRARALAKRTRNDSVLRLRDIGRHVVKHVPMTRWWIEEAYFRCRIVNRIFFFHKHHHSQMFSGYDISYFYSICCGILINLCFAFNEK